MKIITLTDNKTFDCHLKTEHGLSVYIETNDRKILFDTGQSDVFLQNAKAIGFDIGEIDVVVISHGHYDHIGGLISFLNMNDKAQVYLKKEVFNGQYYSVRRNISKNIGYSTDLMKYRNRFIFLEEKLTRMDNLFFISEIEKKFSLPKGNQLLFKSQEEEIVPDDFQHELVSTETEDELKEIALKLKSLAPLAEIYTGHCTCEKAIEEIGKIWNNRFHLFYSGQEIKIF